MQHRFLLDNPLYCWVEAPDEMHCACRSAVCEHGMLPIISQHSSCRHLLYCAQERSMVCADWNCRSCLILGW